MRWISLTRLAAVSAGSGQVRVAEGSVTDTGWWATTAVRDWCIPVAACSRLTFTAAPYFLMGFVVPLAEVVLLFSVTELSLVFEHCDEHRS